MALMAASIRRRVLAASAISGVAAALGLCASPSVAASVIRSDTAKGVSLGTIVGQSGPNYTISGGTRVGPNLFQSFSSFNLGSGETADWTDSLGDAGGVARIINRVTGGTPSHIFGTIDTAAFPNADFYFINPAGVIFGAGASLNVPGAVYFSTASVLKFADRTSFSAAAPSGSVLTVASPSSFGFFGDEGRLTISDAKANFYTGGGALSFAAADLRISQSTLNASGFTLAAVGAGTADIGLVGGSVLPPNLLGALTLSNATLSTTAAPAGAGVINLGAGSSVLKDSQILSGGGDINALLTNGLSLEGGSNVQTTASAISPGGAINIQAASLALNQAALATTTASAQMAGALAITAQSVTISNGSTIKSSTTDSGRAGDIVVNAKALAVQRSDIFSDSLEPNGAAKASGAGGDVILNTASLVLSAGAVVSANTFTSGAGGDVTVSSDVATIDGGSAITSDTLGAGHAGSVNVDATDLTIAKCFEGACAGITSDAYAQSGAAGDVNITASNLTLSSKGSIGADTYTSGQGGDVTVSSTTASLTTGGMISANTYGRGAAGAVTINVPSLTIDGFLGAQGSNISSKSIGSAKASVGDSGDIVVNSSTLTLSHYGYIAADTDTAGHGGGVTINAATLSISDNGAISADTSGAGHGGDVSLKSDVLTLQSGGSISSNATASGAAGDIAITATTLSLDGQAGGENSQIGSTAFQSSSGAAGDVSVNANTISLSRHAGIFAETGDAEPGGNVVITGASLTVASAAAISTSTFGAGRAGDIAVATTDLVLQQGGSISSNTYAEGNGGTVSVAASDLVLRGASPTAPSEISSGTSGQGSGAAGDIRLEASRLILTRGAAILTDADNAETAGDIDIQASLVSIGGANTKISSLNSGATNGAAGLISIQTDGLTLSGGSQITTDAASGEAGDIGVTFPNGGLLTLKSASGQSAITTSSGVLSGGLINVSGATSVIMDGGLIQALGPEDAALVTIQAGSIIQSSDKANNIAVAGVLTLDSEIVDVSKSVSDVSPSFLDASRVLSSLCAGRRAEGVTSELGVKAVGPLAGPKINLTGGLNDISRRCGAAIQ